MATKAVIQVMNAQEFADKTGCTQQNVQRALRDAIDKGEKEPPFSSEILKGVLEIKKWSRMWLLTVNTRQMRKL